MTNRKFPNNQWRIDYRPDRDRWETYRTPIDWPKELYGWLWQTFGHPGTDPDTGEHSGWDYHGGRIYFSSEDHVSMFLLKWS